MKCAIVLNRFRFSLSMDLLEGLPDPAKPDFRSGFFCADMEAVLFSLHERMRCINEMVLGAMGDKDGLYALLKKNGFTRFGTPSDEPLDLLFASVPLEVYRPGETIGGHHYDAAYHALFHIAMERGCSPFMEALDEMVEMYTVAMGRLALKSTLYKSQGLPKRVDHIKLEFLGEEEGECYLVPLSDSEGSAEENTLEFQVVHPTLYVGKKHSDGRLLLRGSDIVPTLEDPLYKIAGEYRRLAPSLVITFPDEKSWSAEAIKGLTAVCAKERS